jgi:putative aldouronate transport system substrate-binding protein
MKHKRLLRVSASALAFAMALSLCACDTTGPIEGMSSAPAGDGGDSAVESEKGGSSESGSGETVTLTYFVDSLGDSIIQSYNDNLMYQEVEKILNVDIDFQHSARGEFGNQLSVMLASGDLPDMIESFSYAKGAQAAIQDGLILDLSDLVPEYAPDYYELITSDDAIWREVVTDEGTIWSFNCLQPKQEPAWRGISLREDLLQEAGLEPPETIAEFKEVLAAFKNLGVDYPFSMRFEYSNGAFNLIGAFQRDGYFVAAYGLGPDWYLDTNDEVQFGPMQDAYKDFLAEMNAWYNEGLLDPDFATRESSDFDSYIVNGEIGAFVSGYGPSLNYQNNGQAQNPNYKLTQITNPSLNKGELAQLRNQDSVNKGNATVVTVNCENPEKAVEFLNFGYTEEGAMMYNYGLEGVSYEMVDGKPQWTEAMTDGSEGAWPQIREKYKKHTGPYNRDWEAAPLSDYEYQCMENWSVCGTSMKVPDNLSLTDAESAEYNPIMTDVYTYLTENVTAFINGSRSLEEFDQFRADLESFGVERALEIKRASYERYKSR